MKEDMILYIYLSPIFILVFIPYLSI